MTPLIEALERLAGGHDLSATLAYAAVDMIMEGQASDVAIAALLTALHIKGEEADELAGAVSAVRSRMVVWEGQFPPLLDTCGTGGDGARSVNVSTATALVVAACGVPVAKHGNRSASGNSGSAEVLAELGVAYDAAPAVAAQCLHELGITFLFAPLYHPAMRYAAPVRKQLPFRTLFNMIGPLANPARPDYQLLGVASRRQADLMAEALSQLGIRRAAVVTGADGLDEVTLGGPTHVRWVEQGKVAFDVWEPASFGLPRVSAVDLHVSGPTESAERLKRFFEGERGPVRDVVLANAAAALLVAGQVEDLRSGVRRAEEALDSGAASQLLTRWASLSRTKEG